MFGVIGACGVPICTEDLACGEVDRFGGAREVRGRMNGEVGVAEDVRPFVGWMVAIGDADGRDFRRRNQCLDGVRCAVVEGCDGWFG